MSFLTIDARRIGNPREAAHSMRRALLSARSLTKVNEYDKVILMKNLERLTITLTPEMAAMVRHAVKSGEYVSNSEIMREALRYWGARRVGRDSALKDMRGLISEGLDEARLGRTMPFDGEDIKRMGRKRLAEA